MTIEDARTALQIMKSHYKSGFSFSEQRTLERLNKIVFGRVITKTGCQDCYRDAFILLANKLNTMSELPKESEYRLKAGVVLRKFGTAELFTLDMRAEDAEAWLRVRPEDITKFQRYPADWESRVNATIAGAGEQSTTAQAKAAAKPLKTRPRRRSTSKK